MAKKAKEKTAARSPRASSGAKQPANIYTMMLLISFLALVLGTIFLMLEWKAYNGQVKPPNYGAVQQQAAPVLVVYWGSAAHDA